jgi:carbonic anhydrase
MSTQPRTCPCSIASRRRFLGSSLAVATAGAIAGTAVTSEVALAGSFTAAQRDKMTPDAILALMKKGNKRFAAGQRQDRPG